MFANTEAWTSAEVAKLIGLLQRGSGYSESILNMLPVGVAILSRDRKITFSNPYASAAIPDLGERILTIDEHVQAVYETRAPRKNIELNTNQPFQVSLHPLDTDQVLILVQGIDEDSEPAFRFLASVSVPVMVVFESRILFANDPLTLLTGYASSEITSLPIQEIAGPDFSCQQLHKGRGEAVLRHKSGRAIQVEFSAKPAAYKGSSACVVTITASGAAARAASAETMAALERVSGQVAHRLNNLLTVVLSYAELISSQYRSVDPLRSDMDRIIEAAKTVSDLAQDLLLFSRGRPITPTPIEVDKVVDGMVSMLRAVAGNTSVNVTVDATGVFVCLAAKEMETVLIQLVRNAKEAIQAKPGVIKITTENVTPLAIQEDASTGLRLEPKPYVVISVSDTGPGIPPEHRSIVFEPFFTTKLSAAGLGLSVAYGIVKRAGGMITLDANADGGSTVRIFLPQTCSAPHLS